MRMRIAVPVTGGCVAPHFGHCESLAFFDVAGAGGPVGSSIDVEAPEHQPGLLPRWLGERGVTVVIARAMGTHAQSLFAELGIAVVTGAQHESASETAERYLKGNLTVGPNGCDH